MQSTSKMPIIIGFLLVIGAVGYYFYAGSSAPVNPDSSLTASVASGGSSVGSNVLSLLAEIKSLNIDTSFFQTPVYQSLTDFSVAIPPEPVGKSNPFLPLPGSVPVPVTPTGH